MPNERVSMSKLKQLIGLQSSNLSVRALGRALGLSVGAVSKYLRALRAGGIGAAEAATLSEIELEQRVFGIASAARAAKRAAPDCAWIHGELKRHRHVTLQLLWEEYSGEHGAATYQRSAFCQIYRDWEKRLKRSMRQRHFAGEKMFVDYAGRTVPIYGYGGQVAFQAHLFISAMGASGCAYAEATRSETLPDWLASHVRALEFYGAAPTIIVPDFVAGNKIEYSPTWHATEERERAGMRVEHHLLALARIGDQKKCAAMTQPHMGKLDDLIDAAELYVFVAEVKLICLAGRKVLWDKGA
jgi:hypothetical protein